jgi:D-erythro-7,8-dihydroneopterin triphosphate epimerase
MDHYDKVLIRDLSVMGILGINPDERTTQQEILVNATLFVHTRQAGASDNIDDAVNYRTLTKAMIEHIREGKPFLVERLVQELADICLEMDNRVHEVTISVEKPGALRHARSVGIEITRKRVDG